MGQRHTEQSMIIMMMIIFLLLITLMASILSSNCYDIFYDNYGDGSKIFFVHLISDCLDLKPENLIIIDLYKQYYFLKIRNLEVGLKSAYGSVTF